MEKIYKATVLFLAMSTGNYLFYSFSGRELRWYYPIITLCVTFLLLGIDATFWPRKKKKN